MTNFEQMLPSDDEKMLLKTAELIEFLFISPFQIDLYGSSNKKLHFVTSQKGNSQLACDGYFYVREKTVRNKIYWRCVEYTSKVKCHSRIHTMDSRIVRLTQHNHDPMHERKKISIIDTRQHFT